MFQVEFVSYGDLEQSKVLVKCKKKKKKKECHAMMYVLRIFITMYFFYISNFLFPKYSVYQSFWQECSLTVYKGIQFFSCCFGTIVNILRYSFAFGKGVQNIMSAKYLTPSYFPIQLQRGFECRTEPPRIFFC